MINGILVAFSTPLSEERILEIKTQVQDKIGYLVDAVEMDESVYDAICTTNETEAKK